MALNTIDKLQKELNSTKRSLRETLIKLSRAQTEATTPASVAKEYTQQKVYPNTSGVNIRKESIYKFNNQSNDDTSSSKYSVWEEEHLGNCMTDYSLIRETGIETIKFKMHDYRYILHTSMLTI